MNRNSLRPCVIAAALLTGIIVSSAVADDTAGEKKAAKNRRPVNVFAGRVLSAEDNKPVAGAKVVIADAEEGFISYSGPEFVFSYAPEKKVLFFFPKRNGRRAGEAVTDKKGRFKFRGFAKGDYALLAVHKRQGFVILEKVSLPSPGDTLDVTLQAPTFIDGTLKGLSQNENDVWINVERADSNDSNINVSPHVRRGDGAFRVGPLPAAKQWNLIAKEYVKKQGYAATLLSIPVETKAGETAKISVDLSAGSTFSGAVRGPKREVLSGVSVVARTAKEPASRYGAVTDSAGKYTLRGLPDGDYVLEAKRWAIRTAPG